MFPTLPHSLQRIVRFVRKERRPQSRRRAQQPRFLVLEDRALLSTLTVTSSADSATQNHTLRYAVDHAQSGDTIQLTAAIKNPIVLSLGELVVNQSVTIESVPARTPTISGGGISRVFEISAGANVTLDNVNIIDGNGVADNPSGSAGYDGNGGAILNLGTLTVSSTLGSIRRLLYRRGDHQPRHIDGQQLQLPPTPPAAAASCSTSVAHSRSTTARCPATPPTRAAASTTPWHNDVQRQHAVRQLRRRRRRRHRQRGHADVHSSTCPATRPPFRRRHRQLRHSAINSGSCPATPLDLDGAITTSTTLHASAAASVRQLGLRRRRHLQRGHTGGQRQHLRENHASFYGGGLYNVGHMNVLDSGFTGNSAGSTGGAISNSGGGNGSVSGCSFTGNSAGGGGGGGISVYGGAVDPL